MEALPLGVPGGAQMKYGDGASEGRREEVQSHPVVAWLQPERGPVLVQQVP